MFRITVDGQDIDLEKVSIQVTKVSPYRWVDEDVSFVWKFSVPATRNNDLVFDYVRKIHKPVAGFRSYQGDIYKDGVLMISGVLKVLRVTDDTYELYMGLDKETWKVLIQGKSTHDYEYGGTIHFTSTNRDDWSRELLYLGVDTNNEKYHIFPVKNDWLQTDQGEHYLLHQNNLAIGWLLTYDLAFFQNPLLTPFFRTGFVLTSILKEEGWEVLENFLTDHPEFKHSVMYNNRDVWSKFPDTASQFHLEPLEHIKEMEVEALIESIQNFYNLELVFDIVGRTVRVVNNDISLTNSESQPLDNLIYPEYEIETETEQRNGGIIRWKFEDGRAFAGAYIYELPANIIAINDTVEIPSPVPGQIAFLKTTGKYIIYRYIGPIPGQYMWVNVFTLEVDTTNPLNNFANCFGQVTFGNPDPENPQEYNSEAGHPVMASDVPFFHILGAGGAQPDYMRMPNVYFPIASPRYGTDPSDFPLMFMLYRGMQQSKRAIMTGGPWTPSYMPTGTTDLLNNNNQLYTTFTCSLKMDNDEQLVGSGIIKKLWGNMINWFSISKREVTRWKEFTAEEFRRLDLSKVQRTDQADYLIRRIEVDFDDAPTGRAEMKMIKL